MQEIDKEIEEFLRQGELEIKAKMEIVGDAAVQYNIARGDYKNRTGNLRNSNYSKVDDEGLIIGNSADYASFVEAKGYMVCSEGALIAEKMLNAGN